MYILNLLLPCFNTLCRVLIGCYAYATNRAPPCESFNTLCRVLIGCYNIKPNLSGKNLSFQYPLSGLDRLLLMATYEADIYLLFQYPLSGLDRLLRLRSLYLNLLLSCFNTLCRVLIGCYSLIQDTARCILVTFQYPLSGLDRLLPLDRSICFSFPLCFNTLCRVLIGCYGLPNRRPLSATSVSIPSVGS